MPPVNSRLRLLAAGFVAHFVGQADVVPILAEVLVNGDRFGLLRVLLHLVFGQRARQFAVSLIGNEIKAVFKRIAELVAEIAEQHLGALHVVLAVSFAVASGNGNKIIKRSIHAAGSNLAARKSEAAAFNPDA